MNFLILGGFPKWPLQDSVSLTLSMAKCPDRLGVPGDHIVFMRFRVLGVTGGGQTLWGFWGIPRPDGYERE